MLRNFLSVPPYKLADLHRAHCNEYRSSMLQKNLFLIHNWGLYFPIVQASRAYFLRLYKTKPPLTFILDLKHYSFYFSKFLLYKNAAIGAN